MWERWDGWTEEAGFQTPRMNSFNHYAYGAVGAWLYSTIAGIEVDPAHPGYKHFIVCPQPDGTLTFASAKLQTLYGELESSWAIERNTFTLNVNVPPNTSATVQLPVSGEATVNGKAINGTICEVSAGKYQFIVLQLE
jgi:alpha-L-rhamnosidase